MSRRRHHCVNAKGSKNHSFEVARHISVAATDDATWIVEVLFADHCVFVTFLPTEICKTTFTPRRLATTELAFRKIWIRHYVIGQLCVVEAKKVNISPLHGMLVFVAVSRRRRHDFS